MAIIIFTVVQSNTKDAVVAAGKPDLSVHGAIVEILLFIPGVTA